MFLSRFCNTLKNFVALAMLTWQFDLVDSSLFLQFQEGKVYYIIPYLEN